MISFEYSRASNVADAVRQIAASPGAKFLAGGTNLVDLMKMDVERPAQLIDISRLPLDKVEETADGGLRIGALVRNSDLAYHPLVEQRYPVLSSAILAGASQQLRNMATAGGNLLQRTRCPYFYDIATPCNKRQPGTGCAAIDGLNRMHAILGTSDACIAMHPSDMCVALAVLEAKVHVTGPRGERVIALAEFHRLPGDTPQRDTNLEADESSPRSSCRREGLPPTTPTSRSATASPMRSRWYPSRSAWSSTAAAIKEARFALGGVAHKPWRNARRRRRCAASRPAKPRSPRPPISFCARPRASGTTPSRSIWRAGPSSARSRRRRAARRSRSPTRRSREQAMAPYIGTAISRVDGIAKVTGAAKYAAEFNAPGLAHGSVVCSTIAKGRITRIDTSAATRIDGVLAVLTHENRPPLADNDQAYKDEVAPDGSPFRPLYDDKIMFNGQPIALVVAESSEIARFAASLVEVEYEPGARHRRPSAARRASPQRPANPIEALFAPPKQRGTPEQALAAAAARHEAEYHVPIEHHNPMELFASTVIVEGNGKLTVYDKTQGVQNVQKYLCGVFGMKPEDVRVMSPFMGGGFGSGLRPQFQAVLAVLAARALQRSVRVVLTRPQMYALGYRPAMLQRIALGASRRNARRHHARRDHRHLAIRGLPSPGDRLVRPALQVRQCQIRAQARAARSPDLVRHARAERRQRRLCARIRDGRACGRARARSARASPAVLFRSRPARRPALQQQGAARMLPPGRAAFGWDKRKPEPRSMRDGSDLVGWGMATGIWEALQVPIAVRIALTANGHAEVACATSDIGTGTYTIMAQVAADMLGLPLDSFSVKLGNSSLPQSPVEGGSWIAASVSNGIAATAAAIRDELLRLARQMPNSPLANAAPDEVALSDGKLAHGATPRARCRSPTPCGMARSTVSSRRRPPTRTTTRRVRTTRMPRCSPR